MQQAASPLVAQWLASEVLKVRGAQGKLATTKAGAKAHRVDCIDHEEVLAPILELAGPKMHIGTMQDYCREFMWKTRPRGKKEPTRALLCIYVRTCCGFGPVVAAHFFCLGGEIKREAWKIRKLLSAFTRCARRPHWPREKAMQRLFAAAGIQKPVDAQGSEATS